MPPRDNQLERAAPVNVINTWSAHDDPRAPQEGIALCLSGGGYRAMLFHVGSLWRLNELGYLPKLARISSVSGGSITAGVLGLKWSKLAFGANGVSATFEKQVVGPIREMAGETIDRAAILSGIFTPGSISDKVTNAYRKHLFGNATLQDLPVGSTSVRDQRDKCEHWRPVSVLAALHGGVSNRDNSKSDDRAGSRRSGVVRVPARAIAADADD